jgi:DNA-binding PadR family transcriptional regulator
VSNSSPPPSAAVDALLPLPPVAFHVLVALAGEELHGYAILLDIASRTGGAVQIGAGSLYRAIHRMLEQGLVVESSERPDPADDDERRRYYRITPLGAAVVRAETARLAGLVALARDRGLAPETA